MYGRSSEGHEQCCRKSDAGPVCLLTFLVMNKQKMGTRVNIPQFDPFPISRFFFLTWAQARQRRPHMGPSSGRTIAVYSYFLKKNLVRRRD